MQRASEIEAELVWLRDWFVLWSDPPFRERREMVGHPR